MVVVVVVDVELQRRRVSEASVLHQFFFRRRAKFWFRFTSDYQ